MNAAQPYPPASTPEPAQTPPPKKRRRVFMWFFLAIQAIFLIWIISGIAGASSNTCENLDKASCDAATAVGTGIGVALIIGLWVAVDIILGIIYMIVRASRR